MVPLPLASTHQALAVIAVSAGQMPHWTSTAVAATVNQAVLPSVEQPEVPAYPQAAGNCSESTDKASRLRDRLEPQ